MKRSSATLTPPFSSTQPREGDGGAQSALSGQQVQKYLAGKAALTRKLQAEVAEWKFRAVSVERRWSSQVEMVNAISQTLTFERWANRSEVENLAKMVKLRDQKIAQMYEHLGQIAGLWMGDKAGGGDARSSAKSLPSSAPKDPKARKAARKRASQMLVMEVQRYQKENTRELEGLRGR